MKISPIRDYFKCILLFKGFNVAFSNYVTAFVDISLAWYSVESCVDDPNKARNNFGSTFLKSNPNLTPQKLKILS